MTDAPISQEGGRVNLKLKDLDEPGDDEFWDAHQGLSLVRGWARARRAGPYALLGEILLQVMARVPPQVVLPPLGNRDSGQAQGTASLNQLIASVGPSGLSKGLAHGLAGGVIEWPHGLDGPVYAPVGSGEGIAATYVACRRGEGGKYEMTRLAWSAILSATEVDKLAALLGRKSATLGGTLRSAWSGEALGEANASEERRRYVPRNSYRLGIVIHVQPGRGGALLNEDETAAGTPQRLLWLPARDPDIPDTAPPPPTLITWQLPQEITLATSELETRGLDQLAEIGPVILPVCQGALDEIDRASVARHRGEAGALDGHALLVREKLAAALGIYLGHFEVTGEDWQLAGHLMRVSDATRESVTRALHLAAEQENETRGNAEARRARIVRQAEESEMTGKAAGRITKALGEAKDWTAHSELRRAISPRYRDYFDDAIEHLSRERSIESRKVSRGEEGHGGTGIQYRVTRDRRPE